MMLAGAVLACALCAAPSPARAESVYVKYRGYVDLKSFDCTDIVRSSFINRVCYDRRNEYMLISLNGTFYHYCEIHAGTVSSLLSAPSMGTFYNANIKGNFDCRVHQVPALSTPSFSQSCDDDTISSVSDDGSIIVMNSGAVFRVDSTDQIDTSSWLATDDVLICNGDTELIDVAENGERASVVHLR